LLQSQVTFKLRDVQLMQLDIRSPGSAAIRDAMILALDGMPNRPQELTDLRALLAGWDLSQSAFQPGSAVYNIAMQHLARETFEDEMGPALFRRFSRSPDLVDNTLTRMFADTTITWFDNIGTPGVETRDNIIRKALVMTVRDLQRRFGNDMRAWKWGELHTIRFTHPLGAEAVLGAPVSPGPFPLGGNSETLNSATYRSDHPYEVAGGPVARFAIDMAAPDECATILSTGESGQPFSSHYSDMMPMWLNGIPHRLFINPAMAKTQRWRVFTLMPE
jgi:penicillin amidase